MFKPDRSSTLKEAILGYLETHDLLARNADGTPDIVTIRELPMFDLIDPRLSAWGGTIEAILLDATYKNLTIGQIEDGMASGPNPGLILNFLKRYTPVAGDLRTHPAQLPERMPGAVVRHTKKRDIAAQL